ncbi:hypothetical protein B6N60_02395 [Richelia sinica FACHB-800]|uniref:Uncharacterized protein n=1 Tax=Richelia sinica FACHB-800 TaxID=1357546 RepID=A0A975T877_9NOST|nr:hypothetical protein B6N60_02395 [Richelia sinica FACHB-800]
MFSFHQPKITGTSAVKLRFCNFAANHNPLEYKNLNYLSSHF